MNTRSKSDKDEIEKVYQLAINSSTPRGKLDTSHTHTLIRIRDHTQPTHLNHVGLNPFASTRRVHN